MTESSASPHPLFPVVGIGASAGGLEAFTQFLRALPPDTGMAFVLVQHLSPDHDSLLSEILARETPLPVTQVADEPEVQPNRIYVIPPDRGMILDGDCLKLVPRQGRPHHPIDEFFRSLAESRRHMALGVVLSGNATDGTLGIEEIKAEGGITFAQDDTALNHGMPHSAIASGCVDFVLPPDQIAREIARIATHPFVARGAGAREGELPKAELAPVVRVLVSATGVDFDQYKGSTLARRISRRMVLLKQEGVAEYAALLRNDPAEVEALFQDILINVTTFFRDPEMFEALKNDVVPKILAERTPHDPVRAWVLGCSTGEEAYSLAIVLAEAVDPTPGRAPAQIFATDLNAKGVERARAGVYERERLANVSRERLGRFFVETEGKYRVSKAIRDMCVFSRHNVIADPPFSRMDLVSCRNLLIYLEPALQQRLIPILHYALNPSGYLLLGGSESVGSFSNLFGADDPKHKIFTKRPGVARLPLPARSRSVPSGPEGVEPARAPFSGDWSKGGREIQREADRLLLAFAPSAVVVDANFDILQFRGSTEPYLVPPQGRASFALLKMARPGLVVPLRALLDKAKGASTSVRQEGLMVESPSGIRAVDVEVQPIKGTVAAGRGYLVMFQETAETARPARRASRATPGSKRPGGDETERLTHELATTREYVRSVSEQHESVLQDLQSSNEEAQSTNEELQSINEELQTTKEEIQSSNEELTTLNDELNSRNLELGHLNSDLLNLLDSVDAAIVIVGRDLRLRRFSPMAERLLGIIPTDAGRPLTDIRMSLDIPELESHLRATIDSVEPRESEVQAKDGRWYTLHVRPYVTMDNRIDGAVLTMTDVDAIRRAREYAEGIVATVRDPLLVLDTDLRVRSANRTYYRTFEVGPDETLGRLLHELGNGQWDIPELLDRLRRMLPVPVPVPVPDSLDDFVVEHSFERVGRKTIKLTARKLVIPDERREAILLALEDVTEVSRLEAAARESAKRFELLFDKSPLPKWTFDKATLRIVDVNEAAVELYGYPREVLLAMGVPDLCTPGTGEVLDLPGRGFGQHRKSSGEIIDVEMSVNEIGIAGRALLLVTVSDVTERLRLERELRERAEDLDTANRNKTDFIAVLSHELRTPLNAISGWAEVLRRAGVTDEDRAKAVEIIARNAKTQAQLISDLLDVHRIASGKLSLDLHSVDLGGEVDAAVDAVLPASREKQIRMVGEGTSVPAFVLGDTVRLQQVFGNLLSNAIKFTPEGGEIHVALVLENGSAEISVRDSGEGIHAEALPRIFERFRQEKSPASRDKGGLGLGLAVCRQLVELHGGSITAESGGKGKGATFRVVLPLLSEARHAVRAVAPGTSASPLSLSGLMVLVVDDEPDAREPVRRVLEDHGAEVVSVRSAAEALDAIHQQRPDVVVSDISMPGQNGYELLRSIRSLSAERGGRVPAIALTALGTAEDRDRALQAGFSLHFAKPVEPGQLVAALAGLRLRDLA